MVYKITIKNDNGYFSYATQRVEITEKQISEDGTTIIDVGTGKYKLVTFETDDIDELKEKYVSLLDIYLKDKLNIVADVDEIVNISVDVEEVEPINDDSSSADTTDTNDTTDTE